MKLQYKVVETGQLLDTIILTKKSASYLTGKARPIIEHVSKGPGGYSLALAKFEQWSNGYVSITKLGS